MKQELENRIERLTRLMGTDEGFYVLALHSFIEYYLRYEKRYGEVPSFPELTWQLREELLEKHGEGFIDGLYCLGRLGKQHGFTNKVRHAFEEMDVEEASAATHLFITFCRLVGIDGTPAVGNLQQHLDLWQERSSPLEKSVVIRHMQEELEKLRSQNSSLLAQKEDYDRLKDELAGTQRQLAEYGRQIREKERVSSRRDERLDALRNERRQLQEERNSLMQKLSRYGELETYLRYLGRLSIYTRTRMDYEHTISRLTPEQEEAVEAVRLKGHFLVRGGSGTGKSLVLLESLRRAARQNELEFEEGEQAVLVTFTRTLAKYNRYISELRGMPIPLDVIDTIDSIFYTRLRRSIPDLRYDFGFLQRYFEQIDLPDFIDSEELVAEIEEFIFALGLSREEYVGGTVSRKGMRRRLSERQRANVWMIAVEAAEEMKRHSIFTKNYGRLVLLRMIEEGQEEVHRKASGTEGVGDTEAFPTIRYLFLDEVQDLTPIALKALRKMTTGPMIMAGDMGQSLYVYYSPFIRSGIDLRGSTKVLRTNFRNTRQIHEISARFRRSGGRSADGEPTNPAVFREGPAPELFSAESEEELLDQLRRKTALFIEEMGYDPENICVLVPRRRELQTIAEALDNEGYDAEDIRADEFSFESRGKVRISTLHSSKGLDFPVVLIYLPYLHRRHYYDDEQTETLLRNLVFVGLTRAMDNLNVFMTNGVDPILLDLRAAFEPRLSASGER